MTQTKHTFCRICEASCGLVAELDGNRIVDLKPNKQHIGTDGFACMKGLNQHHMYDSPDRLQYPLKRVGDRFERISWDQAYREIGAKLRALRAVSAESISMYVGTAAGFSLLHPIFAEGFMKGVGSHNVFSSRRRTAPIASQRRPRCTAFRLHSRSSIWITCATC